MGSHEASTPFSREGYCVEPPILVSNKLNRTVPSSLPIQSLSIHITVLPSRLHALSPQERKSKHL